MFIPLTILSVFLSIQIHLSTAGLIKLGFIVLVNICIGQFFLQPLF
jgi:hypothetical protein